MRRTSYHGSIQVYSEYKGGYIIWKWDGRKYQYDSFTMSFVSLSSLPQVSFRVSGKDLLEMEF